MDYTSPTSPHHAYTPRVALVTGAAQGIGYAIARRLVREGVSVAVNDVEGKRGVLDGVVRDLEALALKLENVNTEGGGKGEEGREEGGEARGGEPEGEGRKCQCRVIAVPADVSDEKEVKEMIEKVVSEFGCLDVMIANAGISPMTGFLDCPIETFDQTIRVNLRGVFLCYKLAAQQMVKQGRGGRIIGASSFVGLEAGPKVPAYVASKFGVRGLTQSLALELRPHGITVNAYAPGIIVTPMSIEGLVTGSGSGSDSGEEKPFAAFVAGATQIVNCAPDPPFAGPDAIASLVSYLVKPESYFITAQTLSVDGGIHRS